MTTQTALVEDAIRRGEEVDPSALVTVRPLTASPSSASRVKRSPAVTPALQPARPQSTLSSTRSPPPMQILVWPN